MEGNIALVTSIIVKRDDSRRLIDIRRAFIQNTPIPGHSSLPL